MKVQKILIEGKIFLERKNLKEFKMRDKDIQ